MKKLSHTERQVIHWLLAQQSDSVINIKDMLEEHFFSQQNGYCLILQRSESYAMFFLKVGTYGDSAAREQALKALLELMAFLNYLSHNGYITLYREEHQPPPQLICLGDVFTNPRVENNKIILNEQGLYSNRPEDIKDASDNIVYQGVELKNGTYELLYQNTMGYICCSDRLADLDKDDTNLPASSAQHIGPNTNKLGLAGLLVSIASLFMLMAFSFLLYNEFQALKPQLANLTDKSKGANVLSSPLDPLPRGIDLARWNGNILNTPDVLDIVDFVMVKASEGKGIQDAHFQKIWFALQHKNLNKGAYHLFLLGDDATEQAINYWKTVSKLDMAFPPIVDIERANIGDKVDDLSLQLSLMQFLTHLESISGQIPMIYSSYGFAQNNITHPKFSRYPLWLADYTKMDEPRLPDVWQKNGYRIWQKTGQYQLNGRGADFDRYKATLSGGIGQPNKDK